MMAMSYENVYVAQVAMGANPMQLLKAVREAEAYCGVSLIICYAPCINHGLKRGMAYVQDEMKTAVKVGYWPLYRYDPRKAAEGQNPFQLDSPEPCGDYQDFLLHETRYAALKQTMPELAESLLQQNQREAHQRYRKYRRMADKQA